jgi:uncharacterized protein YdhG (YjbR/CyaY superfamily)
MKATRKRADTMDDYISKYPADVRKLLAQLRATIRKAAPRAEEKISYAIPTFFLNGNLVHFAGYKTHIGFYPGASGIKAFKRELSAYKFAKGSVRFPLDEPLPLGLIGKIVKSRVKENQERNTG